MPTSFNSYQSCTVHRYAMLRFVCLKKGALAAPLSKFFRIDGTRFEQGPSVGLHRFPCVVSRVCVDFVDCRCADQTML